jgi:hypothetical protein
MSRWAQCLTSAYEVIVGTWIQIGGISINLFRPNVLRARPI